MRCRATSHVSTGQSRDEFVLGRPIRFELPLLDEVREETHTSDDAYSHIPKLQFIVSGTVRFHSYQRSSPKL